MIASGVVVTATWQDNLPGKLCKITYPNGDYYEGEHRSLTTRHGRGSYTSRLGDSLMGEFRDNKFERGQITDRFGNSLAYP